MKPSISRQAADCIRIESCTGSRLQRYSSVREARVRFVDLITLLRDSADLTVSLTDWDMRHTFARVRLTSFKG
jgi:hypothetical protein